MLTFCFGLFAYQTTREIRRAKFHSSRVGEIFCNVVEGPWGRGLWAFDLGQAGGFAGGFRRRCELSLSFAIIAERSLPRSGRPAGADMAVL